MLCESRDGAQRPGAPSILVVPASLLGNWREEAARFAPSLKLRFLHPAETDRQTLADIAAAPEAHLADTDLVVTTYAMLVRQTWLADDILAGDGEVNLTELSDEALMDLVRLDVTRAAS